MEVEFFMDECIVLDEEVKFFMDECVSLDVGSFVFGKEVLKVYYLLGSFFESLSFVFIY